MNFQLSFMLVLSLVGASFLSNCASVSKREHEKTLHRLHHIVPYNLHFRRPHGLGADPAAGPGGIDYTSNPLPNEKFDCEPYSELFKNIDLGAVKACLASIQPMEIPYHLRRAPEPYLEIEESDTTPPCLMESLPRIPLPREIVFQSTEEKRLLCYSSRLDLEADELFWVKVPMARVTVRLPIQEKALSVEELKLTLLSWTLAPFLGKRQEISAFVVTDSLCQACLGKKDMLHPSDPPPVLWP